jgi:hypothetical protein
VEGERSDILGNPVLLIGAALFFLGFILFAVMGFASVSSVPNGGMPDLSGVICGWGIAAVGIFVMILSKWVKGSPAIPPPPPIQQPMVPAGMQGPKGLNCPSCGAPAQSVDRFGVAVCAHCNTRYLVR